jgi:cell division protein FtsW
MLAPNADRTLISVFASLLLVGLVMVYSANLPLPSNNAESVFLRGMRGHPVHLLIGVFAAWFMTRVPIDLLHSFSTPLFLAGIGLLMVVAALKIVIGPSIVKDGAVRAIPLGMLTLQPAELMKFFALLFAAAYVVRRQDRMHTFVKGLLPIGGLMSLVMLLLLYQPDLGSTMVIMLTVAAVLFLGGMSLKVFIPLISVLAAVFAAMVVLTPWRLTRLLSYLTPCEPDIVQTSGYQLCGALIAFGNGGLLGSGLGTGIAKMGHLPLPHTDFIFAMMGEEIGFVGVTLVVIALAFIVRRAIEIGRTAMSQENLFAGLVAQGIGVWIGIQALIHAGVNTGLLPTKGLTLPFISHGGSSMLAICIAMGVLIRIDMENRSSVSRGVA